jgi:hypothetical protein
VNKEEEEAKQKEKREKRNVKLERRNKSMLPLPDRVHNEARSLFGSFSRIACLRRCPTNIYACAQ